MYFLFLSVYLSSPPTLLSLSVSPFLSVSPPPPLSLSLCLSLLYLSLLYLSLCLSLLYLSGYLRLLLIVLSWQYFEKFYIFIPLFFLQTILDSKLEFASTVQVPTCSCASGPVCTGHIVSERGCVLLLAHNNVLHSGEASAMFA